MDFTVTFDRPEEGPKSGPLTVGWFLTKDKGAVLYDPPERIMFRQTNKTHAKSASRCPAVIQLESRYFMVKSPFDIHIGFRRDENGKAVLVNYLSESGLDGSEIGETYSDAPRAYLLTVDDVGRDIYDALSGRRVGSRILQVLPAVDDAPPTVTVFDVLPTRAQGTAVEPRDGLPTVTLGDDGEPTVVATDAEPPAEVTAQPLIRGEGPQIEPGEIITVQYTGATWDDATVFDSTWTEGSLPAAFPIGVGSVPMGWDDGLVEQTVGSQVLLVLPPGSGYGGADDELADTTLVFVVDILAASGGPEGS